ncbi:MAG: DNA recombination protein RmuC [Gammaproteobacteria bacterium]|nr:DNA recombination protein RmuC [Gammaproteobacteria bacterium]
MINNFAFYTVLLTVLVAFAAVRFSLHKQLKKILDKLNTKEEQLIEIQESFHRLIKQHEKDIHEQRERFDKHQLDSLKGLQETISKSVFSIQQNITLTLNQNSEQLTKQVRHLTQNTDQHLKDISGQVEKRLAEGFDKTTAIFSDVIKRLALIDQAQAKLTELSSSMVSLQEVLSDKRSRGAFGEVQLSHLIHNMLPEQHFALQYTLSNGCRVDAMLFLPNPSGHIAIDSKFPLERYRELQNTDLASSDRKLIEQQFRIDIRRHIDDIADKYIIAGETADGAVMFIPAEAVFAEIHAHYAELIEYAYQRRIWVVSPTTLMAILTTASAVLKDDATRKQVHIIQEHLSKLGVDFARFQKRMDNLSRHITQAQQDVEDIHKSSRKITQRFSKIENVELEPHIDPEILPEDDEISLLEEESTESV